MSKNCWSVYVVTNALNGKQYVGMTKNIPRRWHQHLSANGSAPALHAAIKKYGTEGFVFSHVCDAFDFESACDIERMLILQHNSKSPNGYNLTDGGEGVIGRPMTNEDKQVRRDSMIKYVSSLTAEERSEKFGTKNRKLTEEQIKKISDSNKGKNLGRKATDEARKKMSSAHKNRPRKPLSAETKEKIRQALLGRKMPDAEKQKHASFLGKKHTEETKAKIRASNITTKALKKAKMLSEQGVVNA